eukprot:TRINITY_DN28984_c0_g1_i2.p1 TRINITY_DN28984_c0_g1~~TRINITY_DN28984_c0_g1_i2.p1  ORF type:complete len:460 (+),score=89.13 TRINITY_DN28984_c0_g1_i2:53-1432(+)
MASNSRTNGDAAAEMRSPFAPQEGSTLEWEGDASGAGLHAAPGGNGQDVSVTRTPLWTLKAYQFLGTAAWACCFRLIGVYYNHIGLTRSQIGYLTFTRRLASFLGLLFWARICDYLGEFKRVLVVCNLTSILFTLCLALPSVQTSYAVVFICTVSGTFAGSASSAGVIDALCNKVLSQQKTKESYGNQRLWAALAAALLAFVVGELVDLFGITVMFSGFAFFAFSNLIVMCIYLPPPDEEAKVTFHNRRVAAASGRSQSLLRFDVLWFLTNLFIYGLCMALVECFLFIYLLQDFDHTPNFLVGLAVTVMCGFEVPVFAYFHKFAGGENPCMSLRTVLTACHIILAIRLVLYASLPRDCPWLVLLIEPLHGLTFAAMWNAAVEYGKQLAAPGQEATMQAFITGLYYQLADGMGSVAWGHLSEQDVLGFHKCWWLDAAFVLGWSAIWNAGWLAKGMFTRRR